MDTNYDVKQNLKLFRINHSLETENMVIKPDSFY